MAAMVAMAATVDAVNSDAESDEAMAAAMVAMAATALALAPVTLPIIAAPSDTVRTIPGEIESINPRSSSFV